MAMDPCRVLIVDDEADTRDFLGRALRRAGLEVVLAGDGKEALALIDADADADTAVVVTDLIMPRMGGLELLDALRQRGLEPIRIVITSFADKDNVKAALNSGADYLIEKPFTGPQLASAIEHLRAQRAGRKPAPGGGDEDALSDLFRDRVRSLPLTDVEKRIVILIAKGASNATISGALQLSEQTIKNRVSMIYRKLGVAGRTELFHLLFPI
jgi:DNA-binding NarL/FixJ family response regulator